MTNCYRPIRPCENADVLHSYTQEFLHSCHMDELNEMMMNEYYRVKNLFVKLFKKFICKKKEANNNIK